MSEILIDLLQKNVTVLEEHLMRQEKQLVGAEIEKISASDLSARLMAKESAKLARDGVQQLLGAISAYKQCVQMTIAHFATPPEEKSE